MIVGITDSKPFIDEKLEDAGDGILIAQGQAWEFFLPKVKACPVRSADPYFIINDDHCIQVCACRTSKIFFNQDAWPDPQVLRKIDQSAPHEVSMTATDDI